MSFTDDIARFKFTVASAQGAVLTRVGELATESVVDGLALTGAPGQPRDTGALAASWQTTRPSATEVLIATNLDYAPHVEDNVRGVTFKNHGPHSVKLTVLNMDRIVEQAVADVRGSDG